MTSVRVPRTSRGRSGTNESTGSGGGGGGGNDDDSEQSTASSKPSVRRSRLGSGAVAAASPSSTGTPVRTDSARSSEGGGERGERRSEQFGDIVKRLDAVPSMYQSSEFNPLPVVVQILKSQKSDELEEHLADLRRHSASLDNCMQQLVDAYFQGFNRSIRSYSDVLACVSAAQRAVKQQHGDLERGAALVDPAVRLAQLRTLWKRASEHAIMYELLERIEQLRDAPPRIDQLLSRRLYVRATQLLVDAMAAMFGDDLRDVTALIALQATMLQLKHRAFDTLLDELRVFLYADADVDAAERMLRVRRVVEAHIADRAATVAEEARARNERAPGTGINAAPSMSRTWHAPYRDNDVPLPPDPEEAFVCIVVDSLANLDRVSTALSTLVSSMPGQFRFVIDRATEAAAREFAGTDTQSSAPSAVVPFIDSAAATPLTGRPTKTARRARGGAAAKRGNTAAALTDNKQRPPQLLHLHAPRSSRALHAAIWRQLRQFEALFRRNLLLVRALCTRPLQRHVDQAQDDVLVGRRNPALQSYTPQRILETMEGEIYAFLMLHMAPPIADAPSSLRDDDDDASAPNSKRSSTRSPLALISSAAAAAGVGSASADDAASSEQQLAPIVMPVFRFADSGASSRVLMEATAAAPTAPALTAGADALEGLSDGGDGSGGGNGNLSLTSNTWQSVFEPSPHNVAYSYPLVARFTRTVSRVARYLAEGEVQVTLQVRLDRFVRDVFVPHVENDFVEQLGAAFASPDALRPRSLVGAPLVVAQSTAPYTGHGEPRVVMRVALETYNLLYRMWGSVLSLPTRSLRPLVAVLEDTIVSFEARLRERLNEVLRPRIGESSVATMMRDPRLRPLLLSDPLYRTTQVSDDGRAAAAADSGSSFSAPDLDADADRAFRAAEENLEEPLYDTFVVNARQLLDSERMGQLAMIGDGSNWLAAQLRALAAQLRVLRGNESDVDAPTEEDPSASEFDDESTDTASVSAASDARSALTPSYRRRVGDDSVMRRSSAPPVQQPVRSGVCEAISKMLLQQAAQLDDLAETTIFSLRTELRLHLFHHLDSVKKVTYELSDETEPDAFITVLTNDLREAERAISSCMPPRQCRYLFHRLPGLVCNILMRSLGKKITAINRFGVLKMHKNLFLLQRALAVGASASDAHFERVRLYFELTLLSAQELVDYARDHADNARQRFSYAQYRSLLQATKKWPLTDRQNAALMRCGQ